MCGSCPFREGSKYEFLKADLTERSVTEARICHSTGSNAINSNTGFPDHICRGSRDFQLQLFASIDLLDALTDEAWNARRIALGLPEEIVADPVRRNPTEGQAAREPS